MSDDQPVDTAQQKDARDAKIEEVLTKIASLEAKIELLKESVKTSVTNSVSTEMAILRTSLQTKIESLEESVKTSVTNSVNSGMATLQTSLQGKIESLEKSVSSVGSEMKSFKGDASFGDTRTLPIKEDRLKVLTSVSEGVAIYEEKKRGEDEYLPTTSC